MPGTRDQSNLLSIATSAARAEVHPCTIRRAISRGEIRAVRLGPRLIRIPVDSLEAWMRPIPTTGGDAA